MSPRVVMREAGAERGIQSKDLLQARTEVVSVFDLGNVQLYVHLDGAEDIHHVHDLFTQRGHQFDVALR